MNPKDYHGELPASPIEIEPTAIQRTAHRVYEDVLQGRYPSTHDTRELYLHAMRGRREAVRDGR